MERGINVSCEQQINWWIFIIFWGPSIIIWGMEGDGGGGRGEINIKYKANFHDTKILVV